MKSYLKFLSRNKAYTLITVAGLVVSLMFVILLGDYTWRQYSIDSWHKNADRIWLIGDEEKFFMWPEAALGIGQLCPEVEQTCRLISQRGTIKYGQGGDVKTVKDAEGENGIIMLTDPSFFQLFDFPLVQGDRLTALDSPDKCIVTERLARQLFGGKDPIGQTLQIVGERHVSINNQNPLDSTLTYTVTAVMADMDHTVLPNETQLIASMERFPQVMGYKLDSNSFAWGAAGAAKAFFMLRPGTTLDGKESVIKDYLRQNYTGGWGGKNYVLTPLKDIMFAPQNDGYGLMKGDRTRLGILLAAVLCLLFFAVSNYINLTVANTGFRAKEMATRLLFGSSQWQISLKLMAESTLMVALSFALGLALAFCLQDEAAELFKGKIDLASDVTMGSVCTCLAFVLSMGIIAGILPSWQIARYQPIDIVKGTFRFHSKMVLARLFVVVQNVITVTMLTAALVIWLQLNHLVKAPLGFNTENLYYVWPAADKNQEVRNLLEKMPIVERIGACQNTTFVGYSATMRLVETDNGNKVQVFMTCLDQTAFDLYGLKPIKDYGPTSDGWFLTQEAMRQLGYTDQDREIDWGNGEKNPIAGILPDIHRVNVLNGVEAFAIKLVKDLGPYTGFLVKVNDDRKAKAALEDMLRQTGSPEEQIKWSVSGMEESIADTFEEQQNLLHIVGLFTLVAIVISVMGYVGLSLFFIRQRQKEIAVRKVMGSTSAEVLVLMLRTFSAPLLVSLLVAVPLSWYIMSHWLSNFSYRIALSPWIFVAAGCACFVISLLTVIVQSWRAASENPVRNIKTE